LPSCCQLLELSISLLVGPLAAGCLGRTGRRAALPRRSPVAPSRRCCSALVSLYERERGCFGGETPPHGEKTLVENDLLSRMSMWPSLLQLQERHE